MQLPSGMVLRARACHVGAAAHAPAPPPVTPDHVDIAATSPGAPLNPARGAWARLASRRLPRDLRALGWRIPHVARYSDVLLARVNLRRAADCVCCSFPACFAAGTYETMQHLFLECPDVAAAADWLVRLWVAISLPGSLLPHRALRWCCWRTTTACGSLVAARSTASCGPSYSSAGSRPCGASVANAPWTQSGTPSLLQPPWPPPWLP